MVVNFISYLCVVATYINKKYSELCPDVENMLEKFEQYLSDLLRRFGVWGLRFELFNFFSYLRVVATYMNKKILKCVQCNVENILEKFQQYLSYLSRRFGVWGHSFFLLFIRCSNVYEQKILKCVMCNIENKLEKFQHYLSDLSPRFGFGVDNYFSYLCVVAMYYEQTIFGIVSSATLKICWKNFNNI